MSNMMLRIGNVPAIVPDVDAIFTLGLSTSRGREDRIGQFGSGMNYILPLLYHYDLLDTLKLCTGKNVYTWFTEYGDIQTSDGIVSSTKIYMKKQNGEVRDLNMDVNWGRMHWTDCTMAIREIISNAIDHHNGPSHEIDIEIFEDDGARTRARAKDGTVRFYLGVNPQIEEYVRNRHHHFICLNKSYDPDQMVIPNYHGPARFYRRGVLVGEFGTRALFNYNIPDLSVNEDRKIDSYDAESAAGKAIMSASPDIMKKYIQSLSEPVSYWENEIPEARFNPESWLYTSASDEGKASIAANWAQAYNDAFSNQIVTDNPHEYELMKQKGVAARLVGKKVAEIAKHNKVKTAQDVLTIDEREGRSITDPTDTAQSTFDKVWGLLVEFRMTAEMAKPNLRGFDQIPTDSSFRFGFYRDGQVYINNSLNEDELMATMIEEIAHHITQSQDFTRALQTFMVQFAAKLAGRA